MYQIPHVEYYKIYDVNFDDFVYYIYSKEDLIEFISKWFVIIDKTHEVTNSFIKQCTCSKKQLRKFNKRYILFDNYNRIINVKDFEEDSLRFFQKNGGQYSYYFKDIWKRQINKPSSLKSQRYLQRKNNYTYRKDPVPYTRKIRGGPWWRSPRTAKIVRMYKNPEYKEFNRGSLDGIPSWWDDRNRRVQKSWKEQTKNRHQWQKNLV